LTILTVSKGEMMQEYDYDLTEFSTRYDFDLELPYDFDLEIPYEIGPLHLEIEPLSWD